LYARALEGTLSAEEIKDISENPTKYSNYDKIKEAYTEHKLSSIKVNADGTLDMYKDDADTLIKEIEADNMLTDEAKSMIKAAYTTTYDTRKKTVNINSDTFAEDVGYAGSKDKTKAQSIYVNKIKKAAEAEIKANNGDNKYPSDYKGLKVGDVVDMNYGADLSHSLAGYGVSWGLASILPSALYVYKGNGVFERVKGAQWANTNKVEKEGTLFIPEGYERTSTGIVKAKKE
jgi:hypothetical protein